MWNLGLRIKRVLKFAFHHNESVVQCLPMIPKYLCSRSLPCTIPTECCLDWYLYRILCPVCIRNGIEMFRIENPENHPTGKLRTDIFETLSVMVSVSVIYIFFRVIFKRNCIIRPPMRCLRFLETNHSVNNSRSTLVMFGH